MTPPLTALYRRFYETYSKRYGPNTCILLLVGKFYELYDILDPQGNPFTSMRRAIERMNIALKERPGYGPKGEMGLWGGIPEQSLHKYAAPLTADGWTVVVVDQVKDRSDQVVDRIPARILSPGTHIEMAGQDRLSVAAVWIHQGYAASVLDLMTGEVFSYQSTQADDILHMFQVYCVKEVVGVVGLDGAGTATAACAATATDESSLKAAFGLRNGVLHLRQAAATNFAQPFAREEYLRKMFRLKTMLSVRVALGLPPDGSGAEEKSLITLLQFIEDHFPQHAERLTSHVAYCPSEHMRLSNNIVEQLSIITTNGQRSVLSLLERTHSAIGRRAMRERILCPITVHAELETRWAQVEHAKALPTEQRRVCERDIKALYDLPRLHYKLAEGAIESIDILQAFQTYSATFCLLQNLRDSPLACDDDLEESIREFRRQANMLFDESKAKGRQEGLPVGFLTSMSGPRTEAVEQKITHIQETWAATWKEFCGLAKIPVESFQLVPKSDGEYAWEGSRTYLKTLQGTVFAFSSLANPLLHSLTIDFKKSGPITLLCAEIYTFTDSLRTCLKDLNACLKSEARDVCDTLWAFVSPFQNAWVKWLGDVDCTMALAAVARDLKWCRPTIGEHLRIEGLRHPLLESAQSRLEYVRHSVELREGTGWLIYGVNASGKSSLMKAVGIAAVLAQAGSFVPAESMMIRPYDAAFSRIWSHDNLWAGLSSFAVEVAELREIVQQATARSLVLGDEVCSGTESMSATALVASVLERLNTVGTHFMFATHLHDLMKVPGFLPRAGIDVWHLRVQRAADGKLVYDRTLQPGSGSCTYGLEVARAMGLPMSIMERAHEIRRALGGEVAAADAPKSAWNAAIQRKACEICGAAIVRDLEVHHIRQRSEGGGNELRNLVVLCERCHDKHHAGDLEIGELRMTSEGPERSVAASAASASAGPVKKGKISEEQVRIIQITASKHKGRPLARTLSALEEEGITITAAQLRKLI